MKLKNFYCGGAFHLCWNHVLMEDFDMIISMIVYRNNVVFFYRDIRVLYSQYMIYCVRKRGNRVTPKTILKSKLRPKIQKTFLKSKLRPKIKILIKIQSKFNQNSDRMSKNSKNSKNYDF